MDALKNQAQYELADLKSKSGLSNKKWDKALKGLRAKELATVNKTDEGLFVIFL
jgi:lysyl-tRNA synthetase class 2